MKHDVLADQRIAIKTSNLTKRYGTATVLDALNLSVPTRSIYGFLGPNGAGKTTTIRLLMGFIKPSAGSASIFGHETWRDGVAARRDLGYLVPPDSLYPEMSGLAQLDVAAKLSGQPPTLRGLLLDTLELDQSVLTRRLGSYSKGMRQKLALVAAMQHDPALLILDEPTDGLDPLIQRRFEDLLRAQRDKGRTIFMSSHDLAEVDRVCELVAVVRGGRLVVEDTVDGLKRHQRRRVEVTFPDGVPGRLAHLPGVAVAEQNSHRLTLVVDGDLNPLLGVLGSHPVVDLVIAPPSLDDVFMGFYGRDDMPTSDQLSLGAGSTSR
jgi:ABC-2 type transport system ATP-binding protein